MALTEFSLIDKYFLQQDKQRTDVIRGIGDDAAIVRVPANHELVLTMDTIVEDIHFLSTWSPDAIAHKALAVNLSDIAAMAAEPAWATMSLVMPKIDESWLDDFCHGFFSLANQFNVQLIGGDISRGPVFMITLQLHGFVPNGKAIKRNTAQKGDLVFVTGCLGEAGCALQFEQQGQHQHLKQRLYYPQPRIKEALALRDYVNSMIDISDGLAADLQHILAQSQLGATIAYEAIPVAESIKAYFDPQQAWQLAVSHGEDFELCFTASPSQQKIIESLLRDLNCPVQMIGQVESQTGLRCQNQAKQDIPLTQTGYQHFS